MTHYFRKEKKDSFVYVMQTAASTILPLYLLFESVYCTSFNGNLNGHAFFDYATSLISMGILLVAAAYKEAKKKGE